jgi:hypothetical protein
MSQSESQNGQVTPPGTPDASLGVDQQTTVNLLYQNDDDANTDDYVYITAVADQIGGLDTVPGVTRLVGLNGEACVSLDDLRNHLG